jgi:tetratricopeptide (TPR) repeat protein
LDKSTAGIDKRLEELQTELLQKANNVKRLKKQLIFRELKDRNIYSWYEIGGDTMTVFKCKMCGGDLHVESGKTVGVCEYCGTQQTLPKLDNDRRAQMYDRANPFRCNNDHDKAAGIYEMILNEDPTGAEAYEEEAIAIDKFKDMQLNLATEKSKHISSFAEAAEILTQLEGYKNSNDLLRLMKDKIKNITQTALNSNDIQVKYDTIDQLHAIGSFGDAEQLAEQLIEHVNTLVAQMIEGANTLDKINQLAPLEEAINMLSPFVERSDAAAEFMQKLIAEREALISARKKVEKRKTRKRNIYIAAGAALLVFIMAWISTNGFADIRYSATYSLGYDLIKVYKDGNYGIINKFGFEVLPCVYVSSEKVAKI